MVKIRKTGLLIYKYQLLYPEFEVDSLPVLIYFLSPTFYALIFGTTRELLFSGYVHIFSTTLSEMAAKYNNFRDVIKEPFSTPEVYRYWTRYIRLMI